jgi:hygromycin-B 4-O-kinase
VKPTLSYEDVHAFLHEAVGERPQAVERLVEGMESQAFRFRVDDRTYVLRINPSVRGFQKDLWASSTLRGRVPVPRVLSLGSIDREHAYCIAEWVPGVTLEDLPVADAHGLVEEVASVWRLIAESDVSGIDGFGDFNPDGEAPARSWREVLEKTSEEAHHELAQPPVAAEAAGVLVAYTRLIDCCPEERGLIHGDFGSNNVLTKHERVTAVLDWDLAMVGDPLYDIANTYFWATYLPCMRVQASHFQRTLSQIDGYGERISCYALRIGLEEILENVRDGDAKMATWALERSREVAGGGLVD